MNNIDYGESNSSIVGINHLHYSDAASDEMIKIILLKDQVLMMMVMVMVMMVIIMTMMMMVIIMTIMMMMVIIMTIMMMMLTQIILIDRFLGRWVDGDKHLNSV